LLDNLKGKPWHYKSWKEKRKQFLKDRCEQCGVGNTVLVIQHQKQPCKMQFLFSQAFNNCKSDYYKWSKNNSLELTDGQKIDKYFKMTGIGNQIVQKGFSELIEYLNFSDTKTLCKSCAFKEDTYRINRSMRNPL